MPLKRYEIRNEYSLADPQLYKLADKDDPEAILEGVAMAGLVGVLRQLGDLAEFAAEIFHDLHEEVMSTAARGHGLIVRVQQLEAEFPLIERKLLSQTSHTSFLYNSNVAGIDWHHNLRLDENTVTQGDLPRFVMDSYEECRGPPRLFLLDKFDVAGAGACLKRFTDPSFFKTESVSSNGRKLEGQREKKNRRVKKRGTRWRNGETPESFPSSHAKLHQLFLEESIESGGNDPDRRVKLKKRQFVGSLFDQENTRSYMEKYLDTCPQEQRIVHEIFDPLPLTWTSNNASESSLEIVEIGTVSPLKGTIEYDRRSCSSPNPGNVMVKPSIDEFSVDKSNVHTQKGAVKVSGVYCSSYDANITTMTQVANGESLANGESKSEGSIGNGCDSDDVSQIEDYVDALATIESEVDTDSERKKYPSYFSLKPVSVDSDGSLEREGFQRKYIDSQSVGNSATSEESEHSNSVTCAQITEDNSNTFSDHHVEEATVSEAEDDLVSQMTYFKISDGPKAGHELNNVSNTSCYSDPNTKVHSVDMGTCLIKNSLQMEEMNSSAENNVATGERNQGHDFDKTVLGFDMMDDSGHWPGENSTRDEAGNISKVYSDTSDSLQRESRNAHSVCSVEEHTDDFFVPAQECCIPSTDENTKIPFSSCVTPSPDNVDACSSKGSPIFGVNACSTEHVQRPSSHSAGQVELSLPYSNIVHNASPGLQSSRNLVEESGVYDTDSSGNIRSSVISPRLDDGEIMDDYFILGKASPSPDHLKSEHCDSTAVRLYSAFDSILKESSISTGETVNMLERNIISTDTDQSMAKNDHAPRDWSEDGNYFCSSDAVHAEMQSKLADEPDDVTAVENNVHLNFDVEKVEPIQSVADSPRSDNGKDDRCKTVAPLSSSPNTKMYSGQLLITEEEGHVTGDKSMKGHRVELNETNNMDSVRDTLVEINLSPCSTSVDVSPSISHDGMLFQDIENRGKLIVDNPLASENCFQNAEVNDLLKLVPPSEKAAILNEHDISSARANHGKDMRTSEYVESGRYIDSCATACNQSEPYILMPPSQSVTSEYHNNLEAPPLPPLPPMQWRLGRLRNSSPAPERAGQVQVQSSSLPGVHHTLAPGQPVALPAVYYSLAPAQPVTLPAMNHTLVPLPPITLPTSWNEGPSGSSDGYVALQGGMPVPTAAVVSEGVPDSEVSAVERKEHDCLVYSSPSTSGLTALQGGFTLPMLATVSEVSSQDKLLFFAPPTSVAPHSSTYNTSEYFHQLNVPPPETGGVFSSEHNSGILEAAANADNGSLQKKLPRPRNPLIDEVVAIDKSKFRKVERVKPSLDSRAEEVESLLEQMQLRKVDKIKPPVDTKTENGGYILEQLQLRKVGERVKPLAEPKNDDSEFLPKHMRLKKVVERFKPEVEPKAEERESPKVQLRKTSERVKPEFEPKSEETESPRVQLRKVSERVKQEIEHRTEETESPRVQLRRVVENTQAEPKAEERDSLFEQIRNKSFSLKPAVAARPNIQGPRTNLKVAAILEKASNIRQAMVGSDEDDDQDTWE